MADEVRRGADGWVLRGGWLAASPLGALAGGYRRGRLLQGIGGGGPTERFSALLLSKSSSD